jgi:ubiquinone/menaquinone biosynthesis C-methylase UbiE
MMNNYWSTYVQTSEELYKSRELLFHDGNKDLWLKALQIETGMNILEVGCGGGTFCHRIKTYLPNANVVGLDRDTGHIEYAKQKSKELNMECTFVNGDATALPFENNSFDLCFSHTVVDFCDPDIFLEEQFRVLKPGGKVVISTVCGGNYSEIWKPDENSDEKTLFDKLWNDARKNELSNIKRNGIEWREYPKYLQNAGFTKINVDTISAVSYAPDNHNVIDKKAMQQINGNRLSELASIQKAYLMAPNALSSKEYQILVHLINNRYDNRLEQYKKGEKLWDFSTSMFFMVVGVK